MRQREPISQAAVEARSASAAVTATAEGALLHDVFHDEVIQVLQAALTQTRVDRGTGTVMERAGVHYPGLPVGVATPRVHALCPRDMGLLSVVAVLSQAAVWVAVLACHSCYSPSWREDFRGDYQVSTPVAGRAHIHAAKSSEYTSAGETAEQSNSPHLVLRDRVIPLFAQTTSRHPLPLGNTTPPVLVTRLTGKLVCS